MNKRTHTTRPLLEEFEIPEGAWEKLVMFVEGGLASDDPFNDELNTNETYQRFAEEVLSRDIEPIKQAVRRFG